MRTTSNERNAAKALREKALGIVRTSEAVIGIVETARTFGVSDDSVRAWVNGDTMPSKFVALAIIAKAKVKS